jgi:hypothetical protein
MLATSVAAPGAAKAVHRLSWVMTWVTMSDPRDPTPSQASACFTSARMPRGIAAVFRTLVFDLEIAQVNSLRTDGQRRGSQFGASR